jgi:hypothetical protein
MCSLPLDRGVNQKNHSLRAEELADRILLTCPSTTSCIASKELSILSAAQGTLVADRLGPLLLVLVVLSTVY